MNGSIALPRTGAGTGGASIADARATAGQTPRRSAATPDQDPTDDRFSGLLAETEWAALPDVVRARFCRHLRPGTARVFAGRVTRARHSRPGWLLAQVARLVGGPLPHARDATGPATVTVTEDARLGGQVWTRTYAAPGRFPQTIVSVKRFAGPTGLEEYLGAGLVMRLSLRVSQGALVFESAGYDLMLGTRRLPLPGWLSPGRCTITHRDERAAAPAHGAAGAPPDAAAADSTRRAPFSFTLALDHPWLGRLVEQVAYFEEITP